MKLRIIAGQWRSRRLLVPEGAATRPTADRTRETLFSMLLSRIGSFERLVILDLFAGSGSLAMEALSRGGRVAYLVERAPAARAAIAANTRLLSANAFLVGFDARRLPPAPEAAGLVFLDPPYGEGLAGPALRSATAQGWITPASMIAIECGEGEALPVDGFSTIATRSVGKAALHLLRPGS